jgi:hypothetical protein
LGSPNGGAELAKTYLIDALEKHPEDIEFRTKLAALQNTGTIEEDELAPLQVSDDVGVVDAELFETADITKVSNDQPAPLENDSAALTKENAVVTPIEKAAAAPTGNDAAPKTSNGDDLPARDVPEDDKVGPIDEVALDHAAGGAEMSRPTVTRRAEPPKNVKSERVKPATEKQKELKPWTAPLTDVTYDPVYIEAIRYGRAKRIDYALNGAGLDEQEKIAARDDLKQLLSESETFGYGYLVNLRRVNPELDEQVSQGLGREEAIFLQQAWQAEDTERLNELAVEGRESLLVQCAGALLGDEEAREQFVKSITSHPGLEGRGSRALRLVLSPPLKRELESDTDEAPRTLLEVAEDLIVNDPDTVAQALTE